MEYNSILYKINTDDYEKNKQTWILRKSTQKQYLKNFHLESWDFSTRDNIKYISQKLILFSKLMIYYEFHW